jgi:hypothetical protein
MVDIKAVKPRPAVRASSAAFRLPLIRKRAPNLVHS